MDSIINRMYYFIILYIVLYSLSQDFTWSHARESWQLPRPLRYTYKVHWIKYPLDAPMICFLPTTLILGEPELRSMGWWTSSSLAASWFHRLKGDKRECVVNFTLHLPAGYPWPAWVLDRPSPIKHSFKHVSLSGFQEKPLLDEHQPGSFKGSYCWCCQFFHSPLCVY